MKKTILTIVIYMVIVLVLTGCDKIKNEFDIGNKSDIEISQIDVSLSIKEGTLKNTGAALVITNNSDKDLEYGNPYEIEIKQNGNWYKINVELYFTMPAYSLKSKESKEIELNWENSYGKLSSGTYRIIKSVDYEKEEGNYETFYIATEFIIE